MIVTEDKLAQIRAEQIRYSFKNGVLFDDLLGTMFKLWATARAAESLAGCGVWGPCGKCKVHHLAQFNDSQTILNEKEIL